MKKVCLILTIMCILLCSCNNSTNDVHEDQPTQNAGEIKDIARKQSTSANRSSSTYRSTTYTITTRGITSSDGGKRKVDAWVCAQDIVNSKLKVPSTAKYCSYPNAEITWNGGSDYTVKGYVDASNSLGAKIRTYFTVTLTLTKEGYKNGYVTFD